MTFSVLADLVSEFARLPANTKHLVLLTGGATSAAALEAALRVPAPNTAVGLHDVLRRIAADARRGGIAFTCSIRPIRPAPSAFGR